MAHQHPIGDDHPFPKVHELAQAKGLTDLEIVNVYDGALIRLFHRRLHLVFRRDGDPGSAMDRQRFDYYTHIRVTPDTPEQMLDDITRQIKSKG